MHSITKNICRILIYIGLTILAVLTLFPLIYSVIGSFRSNMEFMVSNSLLPKELTLENYKKAFTIVDFGRNVFNSLIISGTSTILVCIMSGMAGFVFARRDFAGKNFLLALMIGLMFISLGGATLYPKYKIFMDLHLRGTYASLIIASIAGQTTNIILIKSFLEGITKELDEAAIIDGCGIYRLFFRIIFPLITPMLVVIAIMHFKDSWNSYLFPMILAGNNNKIMPISVAVVAMKSSGNAASETTLMLAGVTLSVVPMVAMFVFFNKYFVEGLTAGAIKG